MKGNTMTDTATTYPDLITEILRYDEPEQTYRFYYLEPHEISFNHANKKPFRNTDKHRVEMSKEEWLEKSGPNYIETEKHQVNANSAEVIRMILTDQGFRQMSLAEVPYNLRIFVISNQAPIEFQQGLMTNHPSVINRVKVWVRGDLPA